LTHAATGGKQGVASPGPARLAYDEIRRRRADPRALERDDTLSTLLLLLAGHETTAAGLAWGLEQLARHPAALDRLTAESAGSGDDYAEAVVKETLRSRTVLPLVARDLAAPLEIVFEMKAVLAEFVRLGRPRPASPDDQAGGRRGLALVPAQGARIVWEPSYEAAGAATVAGAGLGGASR
jgi:hypothetical protein